MKLLKVGLLALSLNALAADYTVDASHTSVNFSIKHLISNVVGNFKKFEATKFSFDEKDLAKSFAGTTFSVDVGSIYTNDEKRDEHLRNEDFFFAKKFPAMTFKAEKLSKGKGKGQYKLAGNITIKDVTKPLVLDLTYLGEANDPWGNTRAAFSASGKVNRKDFGMVFNKVLDNGALLLGDEVKITIEVEAIKTK